VILFIVQFGLYLPLAGSVRMSSPAVAARHSLSQMVGVIDGFHWCIASILPDLAVSVVVAGSFCGLAFTDFAEPNALLPI
jgi:hypothetical protein